MKERQGSIDYVLLAAVLILAAGGLIMSLGAGTIMTAGSGKFSHDGFYFFKKMIQNMAFAAIFFLVAIKINYRKLRSVITPAFLVMLGVLLLTAILAKAVRGSRGWFLGVQPAEMTRLFLVLFLAELAAKRGDEIARIRRGFLPAVAAVLVPVTLIVLQRDLGSALAIALVGYGIMFAIGVNLGAWISGLAAPLAIITAVALTRPHVLGRLAGFWCSFFRPTELLALAEGASGHLKNTIIQTHQSLLGIGSGGWLGVGWGQSRQKYLFVAEAHTDFIFSIISEEGGLLAATLVITLFLVILWRGVKLAGQLDDRFEAMAVLGLCWGIFVYAAINISVALGLFPITGLPLPFLSYGGTALAVNAASMGLVLNISRHRGEKTGQYFSRKDNGISHSRWRDGRSSLSWSGSGRRR